MRLETLSHELRQAARRLLGSPGFTVTVALTLAVGIGATTSLFSLIDALVLRRLAVRAPEQLVVLQAVSAEESDLISFPDFEDYSRARDTFADLAAHVRLPLSVKIGTTSDRVWGEAVSATYFELLGPVMGQGRGLHSRSSREHEVVVSDDYWRRRLGGRGDVLGQSILVGGQPFTIVGVTGPAFHGTDLELGLGERTQMWLSVTQLPAVAPIWADVLESRESASFEVTGRLAAGVSLARARTAANVLARRLATEYPSTNAGRNLALFPGDVARMSPETRRSVASFLRVLGAAIAFLMLATWVNASTLQFVRSLSRRAETALCVALGARPSRLAVQHLFEAAILSGVGLALSLPLALAIQHLVVRFALPLATPLDYDVRLDGRVLVFAAGLTLLTTAAFSLQPVLRTLRLSVVNSLYGQGGSMNRRRSRTTNVCVGLQIALSFALLVTAGLFAHALGRAAHVDPGFRTADVLVMSVDFNADLHRFDEARARRYYVDTLERVRANPEVRAASWAGDVPLGLRQIIIAFFPEPRDVVNDQEWQTLNCDVVSPGYFDTLGISVRGRDFVPQDDSTALPVAIVNKTMARRYWPGRDPVGQRFKVRGRSGVKVVEIVGVSGDVKQRNLFEVAAPRLYLPLFQRHFPEMTLHVRVHGDPRQFIRRIRSELSSIEPDLPVFGARPLRDQVNAALSPQLMGAALLGASATIALVLATIGVYGVSASAAASRRREMGVRMALGALPKKVVWLVLRQSVIAIVGGMTAGIGLALVLGHGAEAFLFGVSATDWPIYATSAVLLGAVAGLAILGPALQVAAKEPHTFLRQE